MNIFNASDPRQFGSEDGLCLFSLQRSVREENATETARVRTKIGSGIQISKEIDGVWIYNRSDFPIFLNGPSLSRTSNSNVHISSRRLLVFRLASGHAAKIYDFTERTTIPESRTTEPTSSIRLSFVKGWGQTYKRQSILVCPCWLEIFFYIAR